MAVSLPTRMNNENETLNYCALLIVKPLQIKTHFLIYLFIKNFILKLSRKMNKFFILLSNIVFRKQALITQKFISKIKGHKYFEVLFLLRE